MKAVDIPAVFSLYRVSLRASRLLPQKYLREFFRIKAKEDARAIISTDDRTLRVQKIRRFTGTVRALQGAINRDHRAFKRVLEVAFGRKGKLWHELVEPLKSTTTPPVLRIPGVARSALPQYSLALSALLTSPHSRATKPLTKAQLATPPTLPARADRNHPDARLLGPLSARREVNIRRRFYDTEVRKLLPPLPETLAAVQREVEELAGPSWTPPALTRRAREAMPSESEVTISDPAKPRLPRFVRRRYRELLGRLPILDHQPSSSGGQEKYIVSLHPSAIVQSNPSSSRPLPQMSAADEAWFTLKDPVK